MFYFCLKTSDPGVTDMIVENTAWLHFRLNHWKTWHLIFHFHLCVNLWANQARLSDTCKHLLHKSSVAVVWQHATSQAWAGLRFFVSESLCGVLQGCLHKKSYYVSQIQIWTPSDGQSSHWCWGVRKALPTFSKKSVIHAVVNVFWWGGFCFLTDLQLFIVFKFFIISTNWSLL